MFVINHIRSISIFLLVSLFVSCSDSVPIIGKDNLADENRWRGSFQVNGKEMPFTFAIHGELSNPNDLRVFLYNGGKSEQIESAWMVEDSITIPINGRRDILCGEFNADRTKIEGELRTGFGYSPKVKRAAFTAEKSNEARFAFTESPTDIIPNGSWKLEFDTLKNLKRNNTDVLRYNIDRTGSIRLHREDNVIYGEIVTYGEGIQGFEGVMTEKGFICSSLHAAEPFLMEVTFSDEDHFRGIITNSTDVYAFGATKKGAGQVTAEESTSILQGLLLLIKSYFDYIA